MTDKEMVRKLLSILYRTDDECYGYECCTVCPYENTLLCGFKNSVCAINPIPKNAYDRLLKELEIFYNNNEDLRC